MSRIEQILKYGLGEVSTLPPNLSRIEELLVLLIEKGVGSGENSNIKVDSNFSETSTNPIQNKTITEKFKILEGDGDGSIYRMIAFEIAKIVAEAPEKFNTLQEIAAWITTHEKDAAAMNLAILANADAISHCVKDTDYANANKEGIVKLSQYSDASYGVYINTSTNIAMLVIPSDDNVRNENSINKALTLGKISVMMSNYGINEKSTIPDMQNRLNSNESTIVSLKEQAALNKSSIGLQSKNLMENRCQNHTKNNIRCDVLADGSMIFSGYSDTATVLYWNLKNGATVESNGYASEANLRPWEPGKYIVSGGTPHIGIQLRASDEPNVQGDWIDTVYENEAEITIPDKKYVWARIYAKQADNIDNEVVKPMMRHVEITDDIYEPYVPDLQTQINSLLARMETLEKSNGILSTNQKEMNQNEYRTDYLE